MPATPTATPPTDIRKNLFNQRSIKETHAENNLAFPFSIWRRCGRAIGVQSGGIFGGGHPIL